MAEPENGNANRLRPNHDEQSILQTLNIILIGIFQVVCQGGIPSAFKTHPTIVKSYTVTIVIYAFARVSSSARLYLPVSKATEFVMGTLATTLLLIALVPVFGWIVFAIWVLLCVCLAWSVRAQIFELIGLAIANFVSLLGSFSPANYMLPVQL